MDFLTGTLFIPLCNYQHCFGIGVYKTQKEAIAAVHNFILNDPNFTTFHANLSLIYKKQFGKFLKASILINHIMGRFEYDSNEEGFWEDIEEMFTIDYASPYKLFDFTYRMPIGNVADLPPEYNNLYHILDAILKNQPTEFPYQHKLIEYYSPFKE